MRKVMSPYLVALRQWTTWHVTVFALSGVATYFLLGIPTDVVNNRVFGRSIDPTPWSMPVLIATAVLSGLLAATYVGATIFDSTAKLGSIGGALSFFAIGCPVCNKLVLIALGTTGAINFFGPLQPYLAFVGLALLGWAVLRRLKNSTSCSMTSAVSTQTFTTEGEHSCAQQ